MNPRIFLLSPAHCGGRRAQILMSDKASFDLASRIRSAPGATLGEVFSFLSGLYFRGKLAYAQAFVRPPESSSGILVITPNRGLLPASVLVTRDDLRALATTPVDDADPGYRQPLERDLAQLVSTVGKSAEFVLLGSVASGKYCNVLLEHCRERLLFPAEFVGRGDMSRGGLMLRSVDERRELEYLPVAGATLRGKRPAKLPARGPRHA
jgi:hypothetical protein